MDHSTEILDLVDSDSTVTDFHIEGTVKYITITKNLHDRYCPLCHSKLHSKGRFIRHPKAQVLQDGYTLNITLIGRRWECSNPDCNYYCHDEFDFIEDHKRTSKIIPVMILNEMKDLNMTCRQVARKFDVSDSYVHDIFTQYIDLPRKPLTDTVCIDEVFMNFSPYQKYAIVIMDFHTNEILDILPSRLEQYTSSYFNRIPLAERNRVRYLISDMYNPYINYTARYFLNAKPVCDSFHVLQWLLSLINRYINQVKKRYQERDRKHLEEENRKTNHPILQTADSDEVYILKKAKWVLLKSDKNISYSSSRFNRRLGRYMDTYDWEDAFFDLDDKFRAIWLYKEMYEDFNNKYVNDPEHAGAALDELIDIYKNCNLVIFKDFAGLLERYHDPIINSFNCDIETDLDGCITKLRRLSNGPMESFNNNPSHFRSNSHGVSNFNFVRNRILWSERKDAPILAVPKTKQEAHVYTHRKRGSYHKHN